ncbi:MAG TPA: hypothetical protein VFJ58_24875, partial [Armatimonadota bacterium]|nr:hypothetical protein [Armatimonadota bacterium]
MGSYPTVFGFMAALFVTTSIPALASSHSDKKLIEFGWDEPDTAQVRQNVHQMEQAPFDGVVLNAHYRDAHGANQVLEWTGFSATPIPWESLQPALADLKAVRWRRFTDNFLRFNTSPGDVDWFDDFSAITHNAAMAARLSRQGHLKGILFDTEAYEHGL